MYILISIIIVCLILIAFVSIYNVFQNYSLKVNETEKEIDQSLRNKYDILSEIKQKENLEIEIDKIKDENLSSFEFYRKIIEIETKMSDILSEKYTDKIDDINNKIEAQIKYYNENITLYNRLITKFPSNIVSKITRKKIKNYFDNKNLYDKNIKDFKL
ncbi:MAG: LemA family protein [Firmicutes bacterium ADurb.Bin419]|nr:MAG: LemA family protein [Firmicutes bacterium ADurb.Bin419]